MSKKEEILGKLNIKDYNNYLEEVLETKDFSEDTKNFLLSMFYKIEIAYNDYHIVKSIKKSKSEFLEQLIEIIKNNCEKIELVKPLDEKYSKFENKKEKCIVNKEKKQITTLYNEQYLLYAISKLNDNEYKFKNKIFKKPMQELFNNGKDINNKEILRDFDGWAWNIETKRIENIEYNIIFQNILMLIGENAKTEEQIKDKLNKIYTKESAKEFYVLLSQIALILYISNHKKEKKRFELIKEENIVKLTEMEDKINYIKNIANQRKQVEERIKYINKCLNDANFLKKEYTKTNKTLEESEKIFSISDFEEKIQAEELQLLDDLKEYNAKMLPKNYIIEKDKIKENIEILEVLNNKEEIYKYILEFQKKFIEGLKQMVNKAQTRMDVMEIIYKLRYYKFLPYKDITIKEVKELQEDIYIMEEKIYNIACKMNVINQISINEKTNNDVIRDILNTNIIELENIELLFRAENYQISLKVFDEDNVDKNLEYNTIEGLIARMNKKIRLFIK